MAADRAQNLQDTFLNHVRKTKTPLTIFLVNGVKLQGIVTWFDNFCLLLRRDGHSQLVYKHAISTIMPRSPIQQRNLEKAWNTKVLDRTGLILEIFGRRAKTKEGALQVELAHLNYQRSRLVRSWTHLERQRSGFGFMGGPGETQIEADRRLIGDRIARLENELKKVQATRRLHRAGRQRVPYHVVALVGYP